MIPEGATIAAFVLVLVRTGALVVSAPLIGFGSGFSGYKVALVFFLSLLLFVALGMPRVEAEPVQLAALALRETIIGLFLGFLLQLVVLVAHVTGEMIGHEMGFMVARQVDPTTGVESTLAARLYETLLFLALLSMNAHHWVVRALGDSFERAPIGRLSLGDGVAATAVEMFGEMFAAGIVFAAPVMVFLMLVSILIGLLARAVPQLNVIEVGFTVRVLVATGAMFLFAPLLEPAMERLQRALVAWLDHGLDAVGA